MVPCAVAALQRGTLTAITPATIRKLIFHLTDEKNIVHCKYLSTFLLQVSVNSICARTAVFVRTSATHIVVLVLLVTMEAIVKQR